MKTYCQHLCNENKIPFYLCSKQNKAFKIEMGEKNRRKNFILIPNTEAAFIAFFFSDVVVFSEVSVLYHPIYLCLVYLTAMCGSNAAVYVLEFAFVCYDFLLSGC